MDGHYLGYGSDRKKKPTRSAGLAGIFLDSAKLLSQTNILPHPKVEGIKDNNTVAYY
jgi:hypothetical protein